MKLAKLPKARHRYNAVPTLGAKEESSLSVAPNIWEMKIGLLLFYCINLLFGQPTLNLNSIDFLK